MKKIRYLSYYALTKENADRNFVLSAVDKINYIVKVLNEYGLEVEIVSASITKNKKRSSKGGTYKINNNTTLKLFFSFPWGNSLQKILSVFTMNLRIFIELMKVKETEKIIVYHSLGYMKVVHLAHILKKFHLILEVEEIYSDVTGDSKLRRKELSYFKNANSFIFPTKILSSMVNKVSKPEVIIHGTYSVEPQKRKREDFANDDIVHCVYAGTLDPRKGGAIAAVKATEYLPENYHIHILGFGSDKNIIEIKQLISSLSKVSNAKVSYDGVLAGEEYIEFIQSCDIGLSTQNPDGIYNLTSFPSKILSYMANGLRVVSVRLPVVESSDVGEFIYYCNNQEPRNIAKAIVNIDINYEYDSRSVIKQLAKQFKQEMTDLIES